MKRLMHFAMSLLIIALPSSSFSAGGGGEPIVIVADTRWTSGISHWWATLYNESHLYFTIVTCIIIPVVGVIFGVITDFIMAHIGIDLTKRGHGGH